MPDATSSRKSDLTHANLTHPTLRTQEPTGAINHVKAGSAGGPKARTSVPTGLYDVATGVSLWLDSLLVLSPEGTTCSHIGLFHVVPSGLIFKGLLFLGLTPEATTYRHVVAKRI